MPPTRDQPGRYSQQLSSLSPRRPAANDDYTSRPIHHDNPHSGPNVFIITDPVAARQFADRLVGRGHPSPPRWQSPPRWPAYPNSGSYHPFAGPEPWATLNYYSTRGHRGDRRGRHHSPLPDYERRSYFRQTDRRRAWSRSEESHSNNQDDGCIEQQQAPTSEPTFTVTNNRGNTNREARDYHRHGVEDPEPTFTITNNRGIARPPPVGYETSPTNPTPARESNSHASRHHQTSDGGDTSTPTRSQHKRGRRVGDDEDGGDNGQEKTVTWDDSVGDPKPRPKKKKRRKHQPGDWVPTGWVKG